MSSAVLTKLKDPSIRRAYRKATRGTTVAKKRVTQKEAAAVIKAARDGKRITKKEARDLMLIMDEADLTPKARAAFERLKLRSQKRNCKKLTGGELLQVVRTLEQHANTGSISFTDPAYKVQYSPKYYHTIARMIRDGRIEVFEYDYKGASKSGRKSVGAYRSGSNELFIRRKRRQLWRESTIVHEATHAIQDMLNRRMERWDFEAAAHIAQAVMLYSRASDRDRRSTSRLRKHFLYNDRLRAGLGAARSIVRHGALETSDYEEVLNAVKKVYPKGVRDFGSEWFGAELFEDLYWMLLAN